MEQTLLIIKPDGVARKLAGKIITRIEEKNLEIAEMKLKTLSEEEVRRHYQHLSEKSFFPELVAYMTSGPVILIILSGDNIISISRKLVGATDPLKAEAGTIRADFGTNITKNIIHASDSPEACQQEIKNLF